MGKVLILAREEVVAALLGLMVELGGFEPFFPVVDQPVSALMERSRPKVVVIDCDHPDCDDDLVQAVLDAGAKPILFSPSRLQSEVHAAARGHGIASFTLPTDPGSFSKLLRS